MHTIVQYVSTLHTCETWFKHCCQECSTSICNYNYDFLCHFCKRGENITCTNRCKSPMWHYNISTKTEQYYVKIKAARIFLDWICHQMNRIMNIWRIIKQLWTHYIRQYIFLWNWGHKMEIGCASVSSALIKLDIIKES